MTVEFFDRQEESNPLNGTRISNKTDLLKILDSLRNREPFFLELVGENGYNLLIGLARMIGCAQYSRQDGSSPYVMAVTTGELDNDGYMEFLTADTATPVPRRYCIPFDLVKEVAAHFLLTGEPSPALKWEEI